MNPSNSSTSSSNVTWPSVARALAWTLLWLVAFDLAAGFVFRMPADQTIEPKRLQAYFEYGRSVEGKLRVMVTPTDETSAPIAKAGWLGSIASFKGPTAASAPDKVLIAAYGQSFTHHALEPAIAQEPRFEMRFIGGPGAPLSHSLKAAELDRDAHKAQVVLIGVLASALPYLVTLTPMEWGFEAPTPYMYPRYRMDGGTLREIAPPVDDLAGFRRLLGDDAAFGRFRALLRAQDPSFNPLVFDADLLDRSVLGRLVRRSLGHAHQTDFNTRYHSRAGFTNRDGLIDVARALVGEHARRTRASGRLPFMVLFEDRGYEGHLEEVFVPALQAHSVPYVSSRSVAPASDLHNFASDGHFSPEVDARIGGAIVETLQAALPR